MGAARWILPTSFCVETKDQIEKQYGLIPKNRCCVVCAHSALQDFQVQQEVTYTKDYGIAVQKSEEIARGLFDTEKKDCENRRDS